MKHRSAIILALLRRQLGGEGLLHWGLSLLAFWGFTWGEQRDNVAFWRGCSSARASGNGGWEWGGVVGGWRGG